MATIDNIHLLREYLTGVLDRANHHAHSVNQIALAIVGGIICAQQIIFVSYRVKAI